MITYSGILPKCPLIVACSGGVDSIALSHFLKVIKRREIVLYHFNHQINPANDDDMQDAVMRFAESMGLRIYTSAPSEPLTGNGMEDAARNGRLAGYSWVVAQSGIEHIVVCHHLDDAVETYMMGCLQGTPRLIPPITQMKGFTMYRPFMLTHKTDLWEYARNHHLEQYVCEDHTNLDMGVLRNKVRHELMPVINRWNYGLAKVVAKKVRQQYQNIRAGSNLA
jgi:tRNA(Ile)-lysidine synthetase-like protein